MTSWGTSASHIPVLTLIPKIYHITKILEIGSGQLSTPLFLNREIYPDLKELISVEEDSDWFVKMAKLVGGDNRLELTPSIPCSLYHYDMIFVDGPQVAERRARVIRYVMKEVIKPLIVVHDIEVKNYRKQINKDFNNFEFNFVKSPMTGVYSYEILPLIKFKKTNKLMKSKFDEIGHDSKRWKEIL